MLTVTAAPGDGHVDIDVYDNRGDELDVTTSPLVDLSSSGCQWQTVVHADQLDLVADSCRHVVLG